MAFVGLLLAGTASAGEVDQARSYDVCMALVRQYPQKAFDQAQNWKALGGGEAADHCIASALAGLGQYAEAARRLEELAQATRAKQDFKARLFAQAAQAWRMAGNAVRAEALLTTALKFEPHDPDFLVDRASVYADLQDWRAALADLDRAIALAPGRGDAFAFRAAALRYIGDLETALSSAEQAVSLSPLLPEALLERGILRRLKGDDAGARRDWMQILVSAPESDAATVARANLQRMDVKQP